MADALERRHICFWQPRFIHNSMIYWECSDACPNYCIFLHSSNLGIWRTVEMGACLYFPVYCRGSWYKRIVFQNSRLRMLKNMGWERKEKQKVRYLDKGREEDSCPLSCQSREREGKRYSWVGDRKNSQWGRKLVSSKRGGSLIWKVSRHSPTFMQLAALSMEIQISCSTVTSLPVEPHVQII